MAEFSQDYSKDTAFTGDYPEDNTPSGNKLIKVGAVKHYYDETLENENSALPKKDIEELIGETVNGLSEDLAVMTSVSILNGAIVKRTRTLTFVAGVLTAISPESDWS